MEQIASNVEVTVETPKMMRGDRSAPSSIVEISFVGRYPEALADTVRQITDLFIVENRKDRAKQAASTELFLDTELSRIREEVADHEKRMSDFRAEHTGRPTLGARRKPPRAGPPRRSAALEPRRTGAPEGKPGGGNPDSGPGIEPGRLARGGSRDA